MGFLRILHRDSDLNPERSLGQVRPAQCSGFDVLPGSFLLYPWPQPLILPPHPQGPKLSANASIPKFQSEAGGCDLALSEGCTLNEGSCAWGCRATLQALPKPSQPGTAGVVSAAGT